MLDSIIAMAAVKNYQSGPPGRPIKLLNPAENAGTNSYHHLQELYVPDETDCLIVPYCFYAGCLRAGRIVEHNCQ